MIINITLVAIGGFFGAISRFAINQWTRKRFREDLPIGTLTVNLLGSFLLGIFIGAQLHQYWQLLFGIGFMGAFTTFSTFKLESIQLWHKEKQKNLILYWAVSYTIGIVLAFLGIKLGGGIS